MSAISLRAAGGDNSGDIDVSEGQYAYFIGSAFEQKPPKGSSSISEAPIPYTVEGLGTWLALFNLPSPLPNWKKRKHKRDVIFVLDKDQGSLEQTLISIQSNSNLQHADIFHFVVTKGEVLDVELSENLSGFSFAIQAQVNNFFLMTVKDMNKDLKKDPALCQLILSSLVGMVQVVLKPALKNCSLPKALREQKIGCYDPKELEVYIREAEVDQSAIIFVNDACLTDTFFMICLMHESKFKQLEQIVLTNCPRITDNGLFWASKLGNEKTQVVIADCQGVTELGLAYIRNTAGKILVPITEAEKEEPAVTDEEHLALVCPPDGISVSVSNLLQRGTSVDDPHVQKKSVFNYLRRARISATTWNLMEIPLTHPLFETVVPRKVSQVIVPVDFSQNMEENAKHVSQVMNNIIGKDQTLPPSLKNLPKANCITARRVEGMEEVQGNFTYSFRSDVALFIANEKIDQKNCYFEIEVVDTGRKGTITMGCASANHASNRQPGWERNSVAYHLDDGSLFDRENGSSNSTARAAKVGHPGDIVACQVLGPFDENGELKLRTQVHIKFFKNNALMHESFFTFNTTPYPAVGMHSRGEVFRFKTPEFSTSPRCRHLELDEDGKVLRGIGGGMPQYIGNLPMEEDDYFEFQIINSDMRHRAITIGLVPQNHSGSDQPGWAKNAIGFHADDKKIFINGGSLLPDYPAELDREFQNGDTMGCGMTKINGVLSIHFRWNKHVIYHTAAEPFLKNVQLYPIMNPGLHNGYKVGVRITKPFKTESGGSSKLPPALVEVSPTQILYWGTTFQIVGVGKGTVDDLKNISTMAIERVQKTHSNLLQMQSNKMQQLIAGSLKKFTEQQECIALSVQLERFSRFLEAKQDVVSHVCLDEKGLPELGQGLLVCQEIKKLASPWLTNSKERKIIELYSNVNGYKMVDNTWKNVYGVHHGILDRLHSQGKVLYLSQLSEPIVIGQIENFANIVNKILGPAPITCQRPVQCLPDGQEIWSVNSLKDNIRALDSTLDDQHYQMLYKVLREIGLLQQVKCFRIRSDEWTDVLFNCRDVQKPRLALDNFICPADVPVIKKSQFYSCPDGFHTDLLAAIFSACEQFADVDVVWKGGFVCRHEGVEIIVTEEIGDGSVITLSGQSYQPLDTEARKKMETHVLMEMNTYATVIELVLRKTNTPAVRRGDLTEFLDGIEIQLCHEHVWDKPDWQYNWDYKVTVCTLCNNCSDKGKSCKWNGIKNRRLSSGEVWASYQRQLHSDENRYDLGTEWHLPVTFENIEECVCDTEVRACRHCGLCRHCAAYLSTMVRSRVTPGYGTLMSNLRTEVGEALYYHHCEYPLDGVANQTVNIIRLGQGQGVILLTGFLQNVEVNVMIGPGGSAELVEGEKEAAAVARYDFLNSLSEGDALTLKVSMECDSMDRFSGGIDLPSLSSDMESCTKDHINLNKGVMYLQVILNGAILNTYTIPKMEWYPALLCEQSQAGQLRTLNLECPTMPLAIKSSFPGSKVSSLTFLEEEDCFTYNCILEKSPKGTVVSFRKEEDPFIGYCIINVPLTPKTDAPNYMVIEFQDVDGCGDFYIGPVWLSELELEVGDFRETAAYITGNTTAKNLNVELNKDLDCGSKVSVVVDLDDNPAENPVFWELPGGRSLKSTMSESKSDPAADSRLFLAIVFLKKPEYTLSYGPSVRITKLGSVDFKMFPIQEKVLSGQRERPGDRTEIALTYNSGETILKGSEEGAWILLPELSEVTLQNFSLKKLLQFEKQTAVLAVPNTEPAFKHPRGYPVYPAHYNLIDMPVQTPKSRADVALMFEHKLTNRIYRGLCQRKVALPMLDTNSGSHVKIEHLFQDRFLSFCAAICRQVWKLGFSDENIEAKMAQIAELVDRDRGIQSQVMENHSYRCKEIHISEKPEETKKLKVDRGSEFAAAIVLQKVGANLDEVPASSEDISSVHLRYGDASEIKWFEPTVYLDVGQRPSTTWKMKNLSKFRASGLAKTCLGVETMECESLASLDISESVVDSLPDFRKLPKIVELNASHSMILTDALAHCQIHHLRHLVSLKLDELLLNYLPRSFGQLKNLQILSMRGVPWLKGNEEPECARPESSGLSVSVAKAVGNSLNHPGELLKKYDHDNNDILSPKGEIPGLNREIFTRFPRLGHTFTEADPSGIPLCVFEMENLRELRLAYQGLNSVPQAIAKLKRLRVLELSNNPLLESVAGEVAFLPVRNNISEGLRLDGCPSLKSPPNDIVGRGGGAVISFLKRVAGGFTVCRRTKLMFVGLGGAGKTSLLRALMSGNYKTKSLGAKEVTDGIDIKAWTVKKENCPDVTFSTWDFAGQKVYYNTHQFFLSSRAVYLLLWTTRSGYEHAGLEFWLSSIASHAPGAPVFVIGTRADEVDKPEIPMDKLKKKFPQIAGFHFISSLTGQGIRELEEQLVDVTLAQKYMGEQIPTVWLKLETAILTMKEKKKLSIVKWEVIKEMAQEVGIIEEDDLKEAIQFLTYLGSVQYFDNEFLRKYVVINPQWIADVMACVVSIKANAIEDGRLNHADIGKIWKAYDKEYHEWLLLLTQEFDLTFPLPDQKVNLVPCLLPGEEPKYDWPDLEPDSGIRETRMLYQFTYLPTGLFNRAQVRLFQFTDGKAIWKEGSFLKKNAHIALIKQTRENELSVKVQGPEPENVLLLIHEVFEGLIAEAYHGVTYTYLVECPDCINKQRTHDPFLFPNHLIRQASGHAGAFLQCHRFFHSISLNELEAILPPDSKSNLDMQLENSIRKLRDMRKNNSTDILVSYCGANLMNSAADPIKVVQDINSIGYTCWFDEDIGSKTLSDFIVPLKDSKLLIAMVSKEYAEDEKCLELFRYATEQLKKPYVVVTITKSFDWTKSSLGMSIGLQEIFVDLSKTDVYDTKLSELQEKLKSKLKEEEMKVKLDQIDVFISYCWSNSHDAVLNKGGRRIEGALGWEKGDPREIRNYLESEGIRCWLDIEQAGKTGLFEDISEGLKQAKVVVACISDEYANSANCMMELRFAMLNLRKPLVVCVVGTGSKWEVSEANILLQRGSASTISRQASLPPKFYFQQNLTEYPPAFVQAVKDKMEEATKEMAKVEASEEQAQIAVDVNATAKKQQEKKEKVASFQEEFELIQRKLMRFIEVHHAINLDVVPYPKLCVLDYFETNTDEGANKSRVLVCKILCEYEQGWHHSGHPIPLTMTDQDKFITDSSAYLARMNAVLKHSGVNLTCLGGSEEAAKFVRDIELKGQNNLGFAKAFKHFRDEVMKYDTHKVRGDLKRCLLPSGKIRWLCAKHADGPRITILNSDIATAKDAVLPYSACDEETMQLIKADPNYEQFQSAKESQGKDATEALKISPADLTAPNFAEPIQPYNPALPKKTNPKKPSIKAAQKASIIAGTYKAKVVNKNQKNSQVQPATEPQKEPVTEKKSKACSIM